MFRSFYVASTRALHLHFADACVPVGQGRACTVATPKRVGLILGERTFLPYVLGGDPDGAADRHGCAVVTPAGTYHTVTGGAVSPVLCEAILRAYPGDGYMNSANTGHIDRGVGRARIIVLADKGKGHHAF